MTTEERILDRDELLERMHRGETIQGGSALHAAMHEISQEALRITAALNSGYQDPSEVRRLLGALTGQEIDASVTVFPPLRSDFGKALRIGRDVFINSGCAFQDQGGITIGDRCLIGHNAVITTLNHDMDPAKRGDMHPAPVILGDDVWLGANVTILPGVTIGDGPVVGASATVTKDVPAGAVVVGTPAKQISSVPGHKS